MASLQDSLGRLKECLDNSVDTLKSALNTKMGPATKVGGDAEDVKVLKELRDSISELTKVFEDQANEESRRWKLIKQDIDRNKADSKGDKKEHKELIDAVQDALRNAMSKGGGGGGKGPVGTGGVGGFEPNPDKAAKAGGVFGVHFSNEAQKTMNRRFSSMASSISTMLFGGFKPWQVMFDGVIADEQEFRIGMREIAFELEGITGTTRTLQNSFQDIGQATSQTGQHLTIVQQQYLKDLKQGVKTYKDQLSVTKTGLHLSTMIGSQTEGTADLLSKWHRELGFSGNQMAQVARNAQDVARITGVTGDNLLQVMQSSEQFMKNMRNAGTLTASATKQVIKLVAEAQKLGIDLTSQLDAATSTQKLLFESSKETQTLMWSIASTTGNAQALLEGTFLTTRSGQKDFALGLENIVSQFGYTMDSLEHLSGEELAHLNIGLKSYGTSVGEVQRMHESAIASSKSLGEQMSDVNLQMQNNNLTTEEKIKLEKDLQAATTSAAFELMTAFDEQAAKSGVSFTEAAEIAAEKLKADPDQMADLTSLAEKYGLEMNTATDKFNVAAMSAAKGLSEAGGKDFTKDLQKAIKGGDSDKIRKVMEDMNAAQQELAIKDKTGVDPITEVAQDVKEINESIRGVLGPMFAKIVEFLGPTGILATSLAGMAASIYLMGSDGILGNMLGWFKGGGIGKSLSKSLGKGAGGLATRAGNLVGGVKSAGSGLIHGAGNMAGKAATGLGRGVSGVAGSSIGKAVLGKGATKLAAKGATAAGAAALGVSTAGIGTLVMAAMGGVIGAFEAGAAAADIFKVKQEELTMTQQMGAEAAGFLTGPLNFLTFGIFEKLIGPTGIVTEKLAKFYDVFWPLSLIFQAILMPFKVLWATLKGLWQFLKEAFIGLWEGVKIAVEPVIEIFNEIKSVISSIFSPIAEAFGFVNSEGAGVVDMFGWITSLLKYVGKIFGWAFKYIGTTIKWVLKIALFPLLTTFKIIGKVISAVSNILKGNFSEGMKILGSIPGMIWDSVKGMVGSFFSEMSSLFLGVPQWLWDNAIKPLAGLWWDGFTAIFIDFPVWLWDSITGGIADVGIWLWDTITGPLMDLGTWLWDSITSVIPDWIMNAVTGTTQTKEEFAKHREQKGDSFTHGVGGMASVFKGDFGKAWEGTKEASSAVLSAINPMNWFDQGSREIEQSGVAMLHEGEMVVPKSIWENITAIGKKGFGGGSLLGNGLDMIMSPMKMIADSPIGKIGSNIFGTMKDMHKGMFDTIADSPIGNMAKDMFSSVADSPIGKAVGESSVGKLFGSLFGETPQPILPGDVDTEVQREHAGTENAKRGGGSDLHRLQDLATQQIGHLADIASSLHVLVDYMRPSSGNSGSAPEVSTASNIVPRHSPTYGRMQFGSSRQNANKQVVTDGMS